MSDFARGLLRYLDEMPPDERQEVDELARLDRELGEPIDDDLSI